MAIKRIIYEMDSSPDIQKVTIAPSSLVERSDQSLIKKSFPTDIPTAEKYDEIPQTNESEISTRHIGRTFADLISASINNPRIMITLLIFAPFPFYASHISKIYDILYPILYGSFLAIVWFVIGIFYRKK
jgi:hypothetical protein